jgi:hypothetical protein
MRDRACAPGTPACEGNIGVRPLKLGMIGVGQMGSARTCTMAPLEEVRVVAVADVAAARARVVGEAVGARVFKRRSLKGTRTDTLLWRHRPQHRGTWRIRELAIIKT